MPEKDEGMIEKIDLGAAMGGFAQATDAEFVYGELADGSQVKINTADLFAIGGVYRRVLEMAAGEKLDLPYNGGLMIIQYASIAHERSLALLYSNGNGKMIVSDANIHFFSEINNAICVFNEGVNKNYIIKNTTIYKRVVMITFIG